MQHPLLSALHGSGRQGLHCLCGTLSPAAAQVFQELWTAAALLNDLAQEQAGSQGLAAAIQAASAQAPKPRRSTDAAKPAPLASDQDPSAKVAREVYLKEGLPAAAAAASERAAALQASAVPGSAPEQGLSRKQLKQQRRQQQVQRKADAAAAKEAAAAAKRQAKADWAQAKAAAKARAEAERAARPRKPCWLFRCCGSTAEPPQAGSPPTSEQEQRPLQQQLQQAAVLPASSPEQAPQS